MNLTLFDIKGQLITQIKVSNPPRRRNVSGLDTFFFDTSFEPIEKDYRLVLTDRQGNDQEYIVTKAIETETGLKVYAENSIYETFGDYVEDLRPTGTPDYLLDQVLVSSRWKRLRGSTISESDRMTFYRQSVRQSISEICERFNLMINTRVELTGNQITNRYVWLSPQTGEDNGYRFEYDFNASDISRTIESDYVVTCLYGYGRGRYYQETGGFGRRVDFAEINDGKAYLENTEATARYGRRIFDKREWDDTEDIQLIKDRTQEVLDQISQPRVTYSGKAHALGFGDTVALGEVVALIDDTIKVEVKGSVLEITEYLDNSEADDITIGNYMLTNDSVKQIKQMKSMREQLATDPTNGGLELTQQKMVDDLLANLNAKMNEGMTSGSVTNFPGGTIYVSDDGASATYIGYQGYRIADSKNPDGTWNWKTVASGGRLASGIIGADQIISGSINADHIESDTITGDKIQSNAIGTEHLKAGAVDSSIVTVMDGETLSQKLFNTDRDILDLQEADAILNQQITEYKAGGSNLIMNSDYGNADNPSDKWWTVQNHATWELLGHRFETWAQLKNSGLTWGQLKGAYNW